MPSIVIREVDNTRAAVNQYNNFAVVVPVKYDATKAVGIWDDNGVAKDGLITSQADFVKYIGKVKYNGVDAVDATVPVETAWSVVFPSANEEELPETVPATLTETQFETALAYANANASKIYVATENPIGESHVAEGKLVSSTYIYGGDTHTAAAEWVDGNLYAVIADAAIGTDAVAKVAAHYGNQMAYELLGLGYQVVLKKLDVISELDDPSYWSELADKATYDFRYIVTGLCDDCDTANNQIANLAEFVNEESTGRGDCIALMDVSESAYSGTGTTSAKIMNLINGANKITGNKFSAIFAPSVNYSFVDSGYDTGASVTTTHLPASFHYLACAMMALNNNYAEWYAVAGYSRGISKYSIASTTIKLGDSAIKYLEPRKLTTIAQAGEESIALTAAVNLIVNIKGAYYLWGNRTAHALDNTDLVASHFLNIRQLCTTLKKQIYVACRQFTFDPNSDVLWINFRSAITPTLNKMKADQGIKDYKIVQLETSQKATLKALIRIIPIEAVEDFDITISLEDSFGSADATITE